MSQRAHDLLGAYSTGKVVMIGFRVEALAGQHTLARLDLERDELGCERLQEGTCVEDRARRVSAARTDLALENAPQRLDDQRR